VGFKCRPCKQPCHIHVDFTEHLAAAWRRVGDNALGLCRQDLADNCYSNANYLHQQMARTASTNGGLVMSFCWPEQSEGDLNNRYNYVASTAWYYFNERSVNPFSPYIPFNGNILVNLTNGLLQIGWASVPDRPYKVQWCSDLVSGGQPQWHDLGTSTNGNGGTIWFSGCAPSEARRFYRVGLGR
jgi:hypothetical protein